MRIERHGSLRVALPVYGLRVLPRFCHARAFCVAELEAGEVRGIETRVWEPTEEPCLARWLRSVEVAGVLCGGIHPRHQASLEAEGLWVGWGHRGEVSEVLGRWVRGEDQGPFRDGCAGRRRLGRREKLDEDRRNGPRPAPR